MKQSNSRFIASFHSEMLFFHRYGVLRYGVLSEAILMKQVSSFRTNENVKVH